MLVTIMCILIALTIALPLFEAVIDAMREMGCGTFVIIVWTGLLAAAGIVLGLGLGLGG